MLAHIGRCLWNVTVTHIINPNTTFWSWGGSNILRYTGMCHGNGLVLHKKFLDMGPLFVKKIGYHFKKIETNKQTHKNKTKQNKKPKQNKKLKEKQNKNKKQNKKRTKTKNKKQQQQQQQKPQHPAETAIFEVEKPLEVGPNLWKSWKTAIRGRKILPRYG